MKIIIWIFSIILVVMKSVSEKQIKKNPHSAQRAAPSRYAMQNVSQKEETPPQKPKQAPKTLRQEWEEQIGNEGWRHKETWQGSPFAAEDRLMSREGTDPYMEHMRSEYQSIASAKPRNQAATTQTPAKETEGAFRIDADAIVQGVIFSEILQRRPIRRESR